MLFRDVSASVLLCAAFLFAGLVACGDSAGTSDQEPEPEPGADPEFVGFAVCVDVPSPLGSTGFIFAVDELSGQTLSLSEGVETGGGGSTCTTGLGYAFLGSAESPLIQRFELDDEGRLVPGPRVSFGNVLSSIFAGRGRALQFISEDRALYIDRTSGIVVAWNPTEMTVIESIQLEGYEVDGGGASIVPVLVGEQRDDILMFVRYGDTNTGGGTQLKRAGLISLDPETLEYTVSIDERCGGFFNDVETRDGTIYMASSPFVVTQQLLDLNPFEPCMLRVLPGATEFDPDFYVEMKDLTGGLAAGGILRGPGDGAITLAYDGNPDLLPANPTQAASFPTWRALLIEDLNTLETAVEIPGFPLLSGFVNEFFGVGGRLYTLETDPIEGNSALLDVTDPFEIRNALNVSGGFFIGGGELVR
ncbi:MAG: hypothetical protein AAF997_19820 [Myxococcota bacterium]